MSYADRNRRPPRTLTDGEVARILKVTGEHKAGFRDHLILSFALGCALRESEIVALDVEDVAKRGPLGSLIPRRTIQLRVFKRGGGNDIDPTSQRVPLPDGTYFKVQKYLSLSDSPKSGALFRSRFHGEGGVGHARLTTKGLRTMFQRWQKRAGFDHLYSFHHLRHTSVTNLYRKSRDVRLVQKFARHANINTTTLYEHASDEEVLQAAKGLAS